MEIKGHWYPKGSSEQSPASIQFSGSRFRLLTVDQTDIQGSLEELDISSRIGNIPRNITFPDGTVFTTSENDELDGILDQLNRDRTGDKWINRFEKGWVWVATGVVLLAVFAYGSFFHGLPWASQKLAGMVPYSLLTEVSDRTMSFLDSWFLQESELTDEEKEKVRGQFDELVDGLSALDPEFAFHSNSDVQYDFTVQFRQMGVPNAFALPDGTIVVTDTLVKLSENPHELDSVLLHELGHVHYQHGMQQAVRSFFVTVFLALLIGDPSGMEELLVALPAALVQSKYSREHETEADEFSFDLMMKLDRDPIHFANIMGKMENFLEFDLNGDDKNDPDQERDATNTSESNQEQKPALMDYFQSHPVTEQRIKRAVELSKEYSRQ